MIDECLIVTVREGRQLRREWSVVAAADVMAPDPVLLGKIAVLIEQIAGLTAIMNERFAASEKAIAKSDENAEKWRANANEWRAAMVDRENKFASRVEMDGRLEALRVEIAGLKESRSTEHGRDTGKHDLWGYIVGGVGLVLTIGAIIALGASAWK